MVIELPMLEVSPRELGTGLLAAGAAFRVWGATYISLYSGLHASQIPLVVPPPRLVTRGPYRFLRHPMYLGSMLALMGIGLLGFNDWAGALLVLPAWPFFDDRRRLENAILKLRREGDQG